MDLDIGHGKCIENTYLRTNTTLTSANANDHVPRNDWPYFLCISVAWSCFLTFCLWFSHFYYCVSFSRIDFKVQTCNTQCTAHHSFYRLSSETEFHIFNWIYSLVWCNTKVIRQSERISIHRASVWCECMDAGLAKIANTNRITSEYAFAAPGWKVLISFEVLLDR